jgi:hypothetical protein
MSVRPVAGVVTQFTLCVVYNMSCSQILAAKYLEYYSYRRCPNFPISDALQFITLYPSNKNFKSFSVSSIFFNIIFLSYDL